MKFDVVVGNPPFQDSTNKNKTQHKLWIDFTKTTFSDWLKPKGILLQVSPCSFLSPSNKLLKLFKQFDVVYLDMCARKYFPKIGSTFAHYLIINENVQNNKTVFITDNSSFDVCLEDCLYIPNDVCLESISIHRKIIFDSNDKLDVRFDYSTCHNVLIHSTDVISKTKTDKHIYPIVHTNSQIWYSKIKQEWASRKKIMWSRSGYTKPFFDNGVYGGTDMVYYILVDDEEQGRNLEHNLSSKLFSYIFKTARWSGFGNEKVFSRLPKLPNKKMTNDELYLFFDLSETEINYVEQYQTKN